MLQLGASVFVIFRENTGSISKNIKVKNLYMSAEIIVRSGFWFERSAKNSLLKEDIYENYLC
ncbi:MAG: hypothetical protein K6F39_04980 [Lachnospiraceae bacterium]|nr:hypothetical protein [Lachnospiraceae bacterium]